MQTQTQGFYTGSTNPVYIQSPRKSRLRISTMILNKLIKSNANLTNLQVPANCNTNWQTPCQFESQSLSQEINPLTTERKLVVTITQWSYKPWMCIEVQQWLRILLISIKLPNDLFLMKVYRQFQKLFFFRKSECFSLEKLHKDQSLWVCMHVQFFWTNNLYIALEKTSF